MSEETRKPDAVMIPSEWKNRPLPGTPGEPGTSMHRSNAIILHAEKALGTDYAGGQRAYARLEGGAGSPQGSHFFVTNHPHDTLYFPTAHPRAGQPRYRWEQQEDGSVFGFLVDDEARETTEGLK